MAIIGGMGASLSPRYALNLTLCAAATAAVQALFLAVALAYRGASTYTHPVRQLSTQTPADFGLPYQEVRLVTEDGLRLAAWYVPPQDRAALVLVHGAGSNRGELLSLARHLAAHGYGLILFDLRAHGESDGEVSTLGLREVRDVRAAVGYLLRRPEVDRDRVGIYGASLGAAVAMMAAAEIPELRAVVADSGFASIHWLVENQFNHLLALPEWAAPLVLIMGSLQTGVDTAEIAPLARIGRISPRPILIIHGEQDGFFVLENAKLLAEAAKEPKELWILPDLGHTAAFGHDPELYISRVAGFFDRALR